MIENLALKMAVSLKKSVPNHPSSVEIFKFAIALLLNVAFIVAATLGISLISGRTREAAVILLSFAVLRQLTGGVHLKTNMQCVIYSTVIFTTISLIDLGKGVTIAATILAFGLVLILAPVGIDKQSRIPAAYYPFMKLAALLLIASNAFFLSQPASLSMLIQGITLILGREVEK
ncbi:accessory gene regulator ArgB-like protein [Paenibacillus sp. S150]|uniref:accessory gene regulator ArgB-like protein n=1 Tax=Paenibacillus sp. S150 TaxID=2749826 RepID=UPI001C586F53|nr:accessory gene regulator B family protein [Paenibacillus sp. S150]MBW4081855.1 accessory gene regulator B family protein [Paenibacillus sp. S150]